MAGLYGILGLDSDASPEDIRKAYQRLARKWHPDKNVGYESEAVNRFSEISEAYDVLSDRSKREQYDAFCVTGIPRVSSFDFPHPHNGFSFQLNFTEGRLQDSCGNLLYNEPYRSENGSTTNDERIDQTTSFPYPQFSTTPFSNADNSVSLLKRGPEFLYDCVESKIPRMKPPGRLSEKRKPSPEDVFVAKKPKFDGVILSEMET